MDPHAGRVVAEIDPSLSDTAALIEAAHLPPEMSANCVVVAGRRGGDERVAACVVLATTRADVNGLVRRLLDVRKASFLAMDLAVEWTGMEYGGITPVGLPEDWFVLVDSAVAAAPYVVIGSGVRRSKLALPGEARESPGSRQNAPSKPSVAGTQAAAVFGLGRTHTAAFSATTRSAYTVPS